MRVATPFLALAFFACGPVAWAQTEAPAAPQVAGTEATSEVPPADAAAGAEEAAAEAEAPAVAADEQVCRTIERSESRLRSRRERVCRTQAEWDALQRRNGRQGAEADNN
jgi:hypothetical protein